MHRHHQRPTRFQEREEATSISLVIAFVWSLASQTPLQACQLAG